MCCGVVYNVVCVCLSDGVQVAWCECEQLRKAIEKNNTIKRSIGKRLRSNERQV